MAAPQVGVLRRVFIMDFGDGIIECGQSGNRQHQRYAGGLEGCLSFPGEYGIVHRPQTVKLRPRIGTAKWFTCTGEDLVARCICHENDHLDGIVFKEHVIRMLGPDEY